MALPLEDASAAGMALTEPIEALQLTVSGYLAEMTKDLKVLANNAELPFLAYLLSVAEEEARSSHRTLRSRQPQPLDAAAASDTLSLPPD